MQPLINVEQLVFAYPDGTRALDGVDFQLWPGETVALLGPNGSGKTTFLLHLNGLLRGRGTVVVCGLPVSRENAKTIRGRVGLLFQDPDDQLFMPTVLEDVAFGPLTEGHSPGEAQEIALESLRSVGMSDAARRLPQHLSAGEKRRVAIAGVLAGSPEIMLFDEPTTYLDPPGQRALIQLLRELPQAKVLVTHDILFARALATRAVFFENGKIIATGTVDDVVKRFRWTPGNPELLL